MNIAPQAIGERDCDQVLADDLRLYNIPRDHDSSLFALNRLLKALQHIGAQLEKADRQVFRFVGHGAIMPFCSWGCKGEAQARLEAFSALIHGPWNATPKPLVVGDRSSIATLRQARTAAQYRWTFSGVGGSTAAGVDMLSRYPNTF
jgi:hypothetical protein